MVDLRNINRCTRKEHQSIPNLEEQLVNMGTPKYFSYINGNKIFHQLPLDEESVQLMSFATGLPNWPLMSYKCMVMGWCNASSRLQEDMRKIVASLPGVLNIGDDLAVYGDTLEQHNEWLSGLLAGLEQSGVLHGSYVPLHLLALLTSYIAHVEETEEFFFWNDPKFTIELLFIQFCF